MLSVRLGHMVARVRPRVVALVLGAAAMAGSAWAASMPNWFPQAGAFSINPDVTVHEDYGRAELTLGPSPAQASQPVVGHHWHTDLYPPQGSDDWHGRAVWAALRAALEKQGFKTVYLKQDTVTRATLRRDANGATTWVALTLTDDDGNGNSVEIVETGAAALSLQLRPPGATPEAVPEMQDFPYLSPLPGAHRAETAPQPVDEPLDVTLPADHEPRLVGSRYSIKNYDGPAGLSNLAFVSAYAAALTQAGWEVLQKSEGIGQGNGIVVAHYTRNGRDLWARLVSGGASWSVGVADVGLGLRGIMQGACKVPVYGVNFDFDKATIRPDSEPVLRQVLALFQANPTLAAEIAGHTDNVGQPAYNLKLSAARAEAVKGWLVIQGVAASRLSSQGYGDREPLVANDSDAHRARNRRVELRKAGCK